MTEPAIHPLLEVHPGLMPFLQLTADSVAGLLGFSQCLISLRDHEEMVSVAVAGVHPAYGGVELRELTLGQRVPLAVARQLIELSRAGDGVAAVAHAHPTPEQLGLSGEPSTGQHVHHTVVETLLDEDGELAGMLTAITPDRLESPTPAQVGLVRRHALQAATAVRVTIGLRDDQRQIQVADTSRAAARSLATADDLPHAWPAVLRTIAEAYHADDVIVHSIGPDGAGHITTTRAPTTQVPLTLDFLTARAREAWAARAARVVSSGDLAGTRIPAEMRATVRGWFDRTGTGSALLVPIGAGEECLGALIISRRRGAHAWSEIEINGATALGDDLGLVLLHRRMLEQQQKYLTELRAIDAYQDQLVTTVSRLLRAPLERIQSKIEALGPTPDPEQADEVEQGIQEMNQLVEDLLFFSRVADPRRPRETEIVNLTSLARRAGDLIAPMAERAGLTLAVRSSGADPIVAGDEAELTRMLMNVVSNAVRFTLDGSVSVSVARGATEAEITVRDTGTGIPVDDQPLVVDEFFRGDNAAGLPGSGLGFTIASRIAGRHGGRVMLASVPDEGTTVRIYLPLAPAM